MFKAQNITLYEMANVLREQTHIKQLKLHILHLDAAKEDFLWDVFDAIMSMRLEALSFSLSFEPLTNAAEYMCALLKKQTALQFLSINDAHFLKAAFATLSSDDDSCVGRSWTHLQCPCLTQEMVDFLKRATRLRLLEFDTDFRFESNASLIESLVDEGWLTQIEGKPTYENLEKCFLETRKGT